MRASNRGVSLIELAVAGLIMGLVMACTIHLLVACYRHHLDNQSSTDLNDRVLSAITIMQRELRESNVKTIRLCTTPPGIVFASPRKNDGTIAYDENSLQPLWQSRICYYLDPADVDQLLVRKVEALASPTDQAPETPIGKDSAYFSASVSGGSVLARGVTGLELEAGPPLGVRLQCREIGHRGSSTESEFSLDVRTEIAFRN